MGKNFRRLDMKVLIEETGERFSSMTECAEYLGVDVSSVSQHISGRTHTCCGYHLKLIEEHREQPLTDEILGELVFLSDDDSIWLEHPYLSNIYVSELGTVGAFQNYRVVVKNQYLQNSGYLTVDVGEMNSYYGKMKLVHRLVAETFIGKCNVDKSFVNHKNGDKTDNRVSNLEWCDRSHNMRHAFDTGLCKTEKVMIIETGEIFNSASACARAIGGTISGIHDCKTGRQKHHRGYHFEFIGDE